MNAMRKLARKGAFITLADLGGGCGEQGAPVEIVEPGPPGLRAEPRWLTFTCVEPGCDDALTTRVVVEGTRSLAIKRIQLTEDRPDFTVVGPEDAPPFIAAPATGFDIQVTYAPTGDPRLEDVDLEITYTDASADEDDPDRVPAGRLLIPLVRRLIGESRLAVEPDSLVFGPVPVGEQRAIPLTLRNTGFGNVGLLIESVESDDPSVTIERLPSQAILPSQTWSLQAVYRPTTPRLTQGFVAIKPVGRSELPIRVPFVGTSIASARVEANPSEGLDFGEVPLGESATVTLLLSNGGAEALSVASVRLEPAPAAGRITLDGLDRGSRLAPLESGELELTLDAQARGELRTDLVVQTNDPSNRALRVPVAGLITDPEIQIEPASIDFGAVPRGWTVVRPIEISNPGYGALVVSSIGLLLGSSDLFTLRGVPNLPVTLRHDQRIGIEVEFRAEAEASFAATLLVDSNDARRPFVELAMGAEGASCELGCPIQNGLPDCSGGVCAVGSCNEDWYDADGDAATGCECAEVGRDPGAFCADARFLGTVDDEGDTATFQGVVPAEDDVDVLRFFGNDRSGFLSDDYDVRIRLDSPDPSLQLCVYRYDTDRHLNECFFENESCPADRQFRRNGSLGRDDSADYIIRISRDPNAAPTCTPYTVFIRNG